MCDYSDKLIAWLDQELPQQEAAELERHFEICPQCRCCLTAYQQLNKTIVEYCDAKLELPARRAFPLLVPALSAAAAAAVLLFVLHPNVDRRPPQVRPQIATSTSDSAAAGPPPRAAEIRKVARRPRVTGPRQVADPVRTAAAQQNATRREQVQDAGWIPAEPAVQIAIPADAMFAPGAVPQGVTFSAELTIAADGSARQIRLRP